MPIRFDIDSQNFTQYCATQLAGITTKQREDLPKEIMYKVFRKGGKENAGNPVKLSFLAKIFILVKALRKRLVILVEHVNGMDEEQYFAYKKMLPKNNLTVESANECIINAHFVLVNKEIIDTYSFLNEINSSKHYTYLTRQKNMGKVRSAQWVTEMNYINRFISYYESNRKRIAQNTGIDFSEWMVLIYLYDGEWRHSSPIYKEWYKYSFNSSATKLKTAFSSLRSRGYIDKMGGTVGTKLRITTLGKNKVNEIMKKYVLNC